MEWINSCNWYDLLIHIKWIGLKLFAGRVALFFWVCCIKSLLPNGFWVHEITLHLPQAPVKNEPPLHPISNVTTSFKVKSSLHSVAHGYQEYHSTSSTMNHKCLSVGPPPSSPVLSFLQFSLFNLPSLFLLTLDSNVKGEIWDGVVLNFFFILNQTKQSLLFLFLIVAIRYWRSLCPPCHLCCRRSCILNLCGSTSSLDKVILQGTLILFNLKLANWNFGNAIKEKNSISFALLVQIYIWSDAKRDKKYIPIHQIKPRPFIQTTLRFPVTAAANELWAGRVHDCCRCSIGSPLVY